MYIIKNSIKNIFKNKSKNIMIGSIIFGIIVAVVVAFSIQTTTDSIIEEYKAQFSSEITISPDMEQMMSQIEGNERPERPTLDSELYLEFAESEYLQQSIITAELGVISSSVVGVDYDSEQAQQAIPGRQMQMDENSVSPTIKLVATSDINTLDDFTSLERSITEGEYTNNINEVVISQDFADLNALSVGSEFEISQATTLEPVVYKLKVTGIYLDATEEYGNSPFQNSYLNRRNEIITNIETVEQIATEGQLQVSATYFLKEPSLLTEFEAEIREKGLPDTFNVTTDEASYNKIVGPVEGLRSMALMFVLVVVVLGGIILMLLNNLAIKERKYEIGVLRAIGMKKSLVARGLIIESLLITSVCLVLGLGVGSLVSQPISNVLLQSQVESAQQSSSLNQGVPGGNSKPSGSFSPSSKNESDADVITSIDVSLTPAVVVQVVGTSLLLVFISSIIGIKYITRYEPKKILVERG